MDPAEALTDLKQISTQVERAVVVRNDGTLEASTLRDAAAAERIASAGRRAVAGGRRRAVVAGPPGPLAARGRDPRRQRVRGPRRRAHDLRRDAPAIPPSA